MKRKSTSDDGGLTLGDYPFLKELGLTEENAGSFDGKSWIGSGNLHHAINPSTGRSIANVRLGTRADYDKVLAAVESAKVAWADVPMPKRGDIVRQIGEAVRAKKEALGRLISLEMGKIYQEGLGEVQEFIDVCEYAMGLSRTLNGNVFSSERAEHVLIERWNPLGLVGIVTAFNFPCAVLGWNLAISLVCGNVNVWKGATTTSLVTIAVSKVIIDVLQRNHVPAGVFGVVAGSGSTAGNWLTTDPRIHLVSFTGSTAIGRGISEKVHSRFGRTILELGGNNASIIMDDANLDMALRAVFFSAVGTAGQRCTTCRRLIVHTKVFDEVVRRLKEAYTHVKIGDPLKEGTLCGPLHTASAVKEYLDGLETIKQQGGKILVGGKKRDDLPGNFVEPTIVEIDHSASIIKTELFVPILYVIKCSSLEEAIRFNNDVPQGLSSALFTNNMQSVFTWIGPRGSDCGLANVNTSTSGAEIGGAFGGHKDTGSGTESGSDSWKQYMRRATCAINYGKDVPLAQGIHFG
jgi:aldehyde dehydrogenase family 7 protein A1